jgi:hypothetical protein
MPAEHPGNDEIHWVDRPGHAAAVQKACGSPAQADLSQSALNRDQIGHGDPLEAPMVPHSRSSTWLYCLALMIGCLAVSPAYVGAKTPRAKRAWDPYAATQRQKYQNYNNQFEAEVNVFAQQQLQQQIMQNRAIQQQSMQQN